MIITWHPLQFPPTGWLSDTIGAWQREVQQHLPGTVRFMETGACNLTSIAWYHVCEYMDLVNLLKNPGFYSLVLLFHYEPDQSEIGIIKKDIIPALEQATNILAILTLLPVETKSQTIFDFQLPWGLVTNPDTFQVTTPTNVDIVNGYFCYQIPKVLSEGRIPRVDSHAHQYTYRVYGNLPLFDQATDTYQLPVSAVWTDILVEGFQKLTNLQEERLSNSPWIFLPLLDQPDEGTNMERTLHEARELCANMAEYNAFSTRGQLKNIEPWTLVQAYQTPCKGVYLKRDAYQGWTTSFPPLEGYQVFPFMGFDMESSQSTPQIVKNTRGQSCSGIPPFHQWHLTSEDATYIKEPDSSYQLGFLIYLSNPDHLSEVSQLEIQLKNKPYHLEVFYRTSLVGLTELETSGGIIRWVDLDQLVPIQNSLAHLLDPIWALVFSQIERVTYFDVGLRGVKRGLLPLEDLLFQSDDPIRVLPWPTSRAIGKLAHLRSNQLYPHLFWINRHKYWNTILMSIHHLHEGNLDTPPTIEVVELLEEMGHHDSLPKEAGDPIVRGLVGHLDHDIFLGTPSYDLKGETVYFSEPWHQELPPTHWIPDVSQITCVFEPKVWAFLTVADQAESLSTI